MSELPPGVPFVDVIAPAGAAALVEDLQTRLDLVAGGAWRVRADDGTLEESLVPMQPIRGREDRLQVYRTQQLMPGESLQSGAAIAVEVATLTQARLAALGVYGVYSWALVLVEDIRWLHGLALLDWLHNPRIDDKGEILEDAEGAPDPQTFRAKLEVFAALWTPERSAALTERMPPGTLQQAENHLALTLLGPQASFDPRFWQGFAMQLAMAEVRAYAQAAAAAPASGARPGGPAALGPAAPAPPAAQQPPPPQEPEDGLTPLARAREEADRRAADRAAAGADLPEEEPVAEELDGPAVVWGTAGSGPILWLPADRFDVALLRSLREGSLDGLARSERPAGEVLEAWMELGAPFVTEVPFLSRLFLDGVPMHRGSFEAAVQEVDGFTVVDCHLPRVSPVRVVSIPPEAGGRRRLLLSSDLELSPGRVVEIATA